MDIAKLKELLGDDAGNENERFGLFWPGKKRALRAAQAPTTATLKLDLTHSKNWDTTQNVFIEGDNLEVLKILQKHYHNKIKLIYIDPPYNTGKDFVYPDNYVEGLQTYLEWTRQVSEEGKPVSSNKETEGRYHSNWLNMMYPRLKLARNLLTDDGVIFISIDDNEVANLHRLCSEVFGEDRVLGTFVWRRRQTSDSRNFSRISPDHEYIICIAKSGVSQLRGSDIDASKYSNPDNDPRGPWASIDLSGLATANQRPNLHYDLIDPETEIAYPPNPNRGWSKGKNTMADLIAEKRVLFPGSPTGRPREKKFLSELRSEVTGYSTWLSSDIVGNNMAATREVRDLLDAKLFDFPKSTALLKELIRQGSNGPDIILDFFAGSSTTAHAVMALNAEDSGNRRFIMVQLPEPMPEDSEARKAGFKTIADISRRRIELAGEKIRADSPDNSITTQNLDTGFRAYRLADTNFAKWRVASDITPDKLQEELFRMRDSTADNATADDLLTEILLKIGFSLTAKITPAEIAGLAVRWVGTAQEDKLVLAWLDEHIKPTLEQLRALVAANPVRLIVLENAFKGDDGDELKTNLAQLCKSRNIELWTAWP